MADAATPYDIYGECVSLVEEGRHQDAIPLLRKVVEESPEYYDAYYTLARSLYASGRYQEAEEICARLAKLLPRDVAVKELWARALRAVDEPKRAAQVCQRGTGSPCGLVAVRRACAHHGPFLGPQRRVVISFARSTVPHPRPGRS